MKLNSTEHLCKCIHSSIIYNSPKLEMTQMTISRMTKQAAVCSYKTRLSNIKRKELFYPAKEPRHQKYILYDPFT